MEEEAAAKILEEEAISKAVAAKVAVQTAADSTPSFLGLFSFAWCRPPTDIAKFDAAGDEQGQLVGEDDAAMGA